MLPLAAKGTPTKLVDILFLGIRQPQNPWKQCNKNTLVVNKHFLPKKLIEERIIADLQIYQFLTVQQKSGKAL